jgi:hypothetical protein
MHAVRRKLASVVFAESEMVPFRARVAKIGKKYIKIKIIPKKIQFFYRTISHKSHLLINLTFFSPVSHFSGQEFPPPTSGYPGTVPVVWIVVSYSMCKYLYVHKPSRNVVYIV